MAALVVQSRFAGLKIDDEHPSTAGSQKSKKSKTATPKKSELLLKKAKINNSKTQQNALKKKKPKQNAGSSNQWEQWKQKDAELVDGNFETELQQAILLSKLDYEEKKDVYKQIKKEADIEKKVMEQNSRASNKKQKKKTIMSLDQFNDMVNAGENTSKVVEEDCNDIDEVKVSLKDTEFFERVKDDTRNELIKEKINDRVRHRQSLPDDVITRVQYIDTIEKKDKEIELLRQEITSLKHEIMTVKTRNKKLYKILGQGEMKDKAEVLVEVERLLAVQAELTAEIANLHSDLEKERSKNAQDPRSKDKKKKVQP